MSSILEAGNNTWIRDFDKSKPRFKKLTKKALLSYLTQPVIDHINGHQTNRFSNSGLAVYWPTVLNRLGYSVDIINWDNKDFVPIEGYDLVVMHGGKNFEQVSKRLSGGYKLIYFSTGTYWKFGNDQEETRLRDFKKRRGVTLPRDRYITESEESVNRAADAIVALGNDFTRQTYRDFKNVFTINIANYPDDRYDHISRNYAVAKNNWLFFAGGGNIHKGLDLAIEAFAGLDQHLYIVTPLEKIFTDCYKKEAKLPNIHFIGEVPMRTDRFYDIADKCAFQIFPSCSEGQPGSVTEAMNLGIAPVVSRESGLSPSDCVKVLEQNSVGRIRDAVTQLSALEPSEVKKMSIRTHHNALKNHNPQKFTKDLEKIIRRIENS